MVRIRRFSVLRTATVAAVMYFVITLLFMLPLALILSAAPSVPAGPGAQPFGDPGSMGAGVVLVLVIVLPVVYAVFGWIITAIACLLYNLVASMTGGIEMELVQLVPPSAPAWQQPSPSAPQSEWGTPQG